MRLSDTIYKMMDDARQRVIETMRERNIKVVNLVMTLEEYAKEVGADDVKQAEGDYNDYYIPDEAPYVIFFDKWGRGIDYAALSVELEDGEHPDFKLNCHSSEEGDDWFHDYALTPLSMVNVYDCMLEELLGIKDEPEKVYVFTAEQAWDGEVGDTTVKVFRTKEAAQEFMQKYIHEDDEESIEDYVKRKGWVVEMDDSDLYRAYESGYYSTNHIELTITERNVE